jgi:hypothetical protein
VGNEAVPSQPPAASLDGASSYEDDIVSELLPEKLDWKRLVRSYPLSALMVAGLGGFMLGRARGGAIIAALSAFALAQVDARVAELLPDEEP